jgi:hypothetical protein
MFCHDPLVPGIAPDNGHMANEHIRMSTQPLHNGNSQRTYRGQAKLPRVTTGQEQRRDSVEPRHAEARASILVVNVPICSRGMAESPLSRFI